MTPQKNSNWGMKSETPHMCLNVFRRLIIRFKVLKPGITTKPRGDVTPTEMKLSGEGRDDDQSLIC